MDLNQFQYAFIGVMFCIVCVWATMFVGGDESNLEIFVPTGKDAICSCENSPLFLTLDSSGTIKYKNQMVTKDDVLNTITILRNEGWRYAVDISASANASHNDVVELTGQIKSQFEGINVIWRVNET